MDYLIFIGSVYLTIRVLNDLSEIIIAIKESL